MARELRESGRRLEAGTHAQLDDLGRRYGGDPLSPRRLGPTRVFDTPLAETLIAGMAVGLAVQGFRPVAEIQFMGFIYSTLDQVINHASRLRNRTRGRRADRSSPTLR